MNVQAVPRGRMPCPTVSQLFPKPPFPFFRATTDTTTCCCCSHDTSDMLGVNVVILCAPQLQVKSPFPVYIGCY